MDLLIETYKNTGTIHHAYIVEGSAEDIRLKLFDFIEKHLKLPVSGNPDLWHGQFETFSIDDARKIRDAQSNKGVSGDRKIFIIETRGITVEAQNSLLKVLEEPTSGTHIFIILPSSEIVLPTLRSRVMIVSLRNEHDPKIEARKFLKVSLAERLEMVGEIAEEKDKAKAQELIEGLLLELHTKKGNETVLRELLKSRMYINDRSPSLKLLLEHIACILP
jgi:DNA polymerase III delta prime subunit